jgi:CO/xanthine dehydrogenase FAD-binding subunit
MRAYLPAYDLRQPADLDDLLRLLAAEPGTWRPFAGGTDLMVLMEAGKLAHKHYVNVWGLPELRGIEVRDDGMTLGALTTYADVMAHAVLQSEFPLLCRAAAETGGVATQNRGTIGGNIANASPAADTPPALLVYDAELDLVSVRGERRVAYERFHTGYKVMDLAPDEIIRSVRIPRRTRAWRDTYRKVGTRRAQAISKLCFAASLDLHEGVVRDVRVACGSVAPTVVRCRHVETALRQQRLDGKLARRAASELARDIAPIDDLRSTAHYRQRVAENLLAEFLESAADGKSL